MAGEGNGLTLQGLAQRLEALQRENAQNAERLETQAQGLQTLQRENAEVWEEVTALRASGTRRSEAAELRGSDTSRDGESASEVEGRVSRRSLLSKAGAAAVAAMAAGTLMYPRPANADHFGPGINVDCVWAHSDGVNVAVLGEAPDGYGVQGKGRWGVRGDGVDTGVWGRASTGGHSGVYGEHIGTSGYGVVGDGKGDAAGVLGRNPNATGVRGEGVIGVWGQTSTTGEAAVYARHNGFGPGVVADGWGANHAAILGRNPDGTAVWGKTSKTGYGSVYGEHTGTSGYGVVGDGKGESGAGVLGRNNSGYGGQFEGGKAQLKLKPSSTRGKPTTGTHAKGEIYMDSAGTLFVCTAGDGSTVGTWKRVNTTAV